MDRRPLPIRFRVEGELVSGETLIRAAGPNVVVLSSTLEDVGLRLHAAYVGNPDDGEVLVAETADSGEGWSLGPPRELEGLPDALNYERSTLLYDHLARLVVLASERGLKLRPDDASLELAVRTLDPLARA